MNNVSDNTPDRDSALECWVYDLQLLKIGIQHSPEKPEKTCSSTEIYLGDCQK